VIKDIRIESSTFYFTNFSRIFWVSRNADNVYISEIYMGTNNWAPFLIWCNNQNITGRNNNLINHKFSIDKYYAFNTFKPCQDNLNTFIHLIDHFHYQLF
jgi:hypothetical protein